MSRLTPWWLCVLLSHSAQANVDAVWVAALQEEAATASAQTAPAPLSNEVLRAAWAKLDAAGQREAAEWFRQEARALPIFQNTLIAYAKGRLEKDPYDWPKPQADPVFDPKTHAPAQPIARVPAATESKAYQRQWTRLLAFRKDRRLRSAWSYDYVARTVERVGDPRDPAHLFENGIQGFAPDLDLVEALTQMALDDGALQAVHAAFGHTYAIRSGQCFPGITLYDAWSSGQKIEMPDVECLGLLHILLDDWKSFTAPVPGNRQKPLYQKIEELFLPIYRARSLQTALARSYLIAAPKLDDGYAGTETFLHHRWELASSDPAKLQGELPAAKKWESWMKQGQKKLRRDEAALALAQGRQQHLAYGEAQVRLVWERVLRGMGVLADPQTRE